MSLRIAIPFVLALLLAAACSTSAAAAAPDRLDRSFTTVVRPYLETYCLDCHGSTQPKADFDLSPFTTVARVIADDARWAMVLDQIDAGEMPPKKARQHPTPKESQAVLDWIRELRAREAARHAGDPGPVLARRLSNAEYDYTIQDLTGVDLHPTREFPVDPANRDGFDNSGESLTLSPALLKKYLQAAREVADSLLLTPEGLSFAPHPMLVDTDRDKYSVLRIVDFYRRQPTDLADYFEAAWRFQHRRHLGDRRATRADIARAARISPAYLERIWTALTDPREKVGPIAQLQTQFRALPVPNRGQTNLAHDGAIALRDRVLSLRRKLVPEVGNLSAPGVNPGSQSFVLWKNRQMAANRRRFEPSLLQVDGRVPDNTPVGEGMRAPKPKASKDAKPVLPDPDLFVPSDPAQRAAVEAAFARFCSVFPDAFFISERARVFLEPGADKANVGRLLSAGFHSMTGFFRDDAPLCDLILDDSQRRELDRLWTEFELVAEIHQRMHTSFIWFERTEGRFLMDDEFNFARSEDKDCTSDSKVRQLAELYLAKVQRSGTAEPVLAAIREHFERTSANLRRIDRLRAESEPRQLNALADFAQRAWRRPLDPTERADLLGFYRGLRSRDGLNHEEAVRDCVVSVLMSPHFLYRIDLVDTSTPAPSNKPSRRTIFTPVQSHAPAGTIPLSDHALANRLSYFLWAGPPDAALLARAQAGDLHRPDVLVAETRRMLQDDRIRRLAVEFGGHWLDFRRFEEHNAVDRVRFPTFDDTLRKSMFEEPVRFLQYVFRANRPVLDLLNADYTFVNAPLARHYGIPFPLDAPTPWVRVDPTRTSGRGGLLTMSAFLTANSPGLRTSPVKRGYWIARRVLGERIPPPPAAVPELPSDEAHLGELTLRQTLERHRADPSCASCHRRFDSLGLVFEGFGPVGERRTLDLGNHPVDTSATFPDGSTGSGIDGLRTYIAAHRQEDFLDNLCRKLLAYALGRSLILSDEPTIRSLRARLDSNGQRIGSLVEGIVTSPQFLHRRAPEFPAHP
jgi:hypothetical protein